MYSKRQASQIRQEFWTAFGRYMQPILSSEGEKVNWINYKTGAKHIYFRMEAGKNASIGIEITDSNEVQRLEYYNKFISLEAMFTNEMNEAWIWQKEVKDETGKNISRIYTELTGVHLFNRDDWPELISFFKPRIIALDAFWNNAKHAFDVW